MPHHNAALTETGRHLRRRKPRQVVNAQQVRALQSPGNRDRESGQKASVRFRARHVPDHVAGHRRTRNQRQKRRVSMWRGQ
jgi:hypothetical protein